MQLNKWLNLVELGKKWIGKLSNWVSAMLYKISVLKNDNSSFQILKERLWENSEDLKYLYYLVTKSNWKITWEDLVKYTNIENWRIEWIYYDELYIDNTVEIEVFKKFKKIRRLYIEWVEKVVFPDLEEIKVHDKKDWVLILEGVEDFQAPLLESIGSLHLDRVGHLDLSKLKKVKDIFWISNVSNVEFNIDKVDLLEIKNSENVKIFVEGSINNIVLEHTNNVEISAKNIWKIIKKEDKRTKLFVN